MERAERWKKLCRDKGWLQGDSFVAPEGYQLYFAFRGVGKVLSSDGTAAPGFFVASDISQTSLKNAPSTAQATEDFIIAKPVKGYNVSIWTHYLWDDIVSLELLKVDADRVT